MNTKEKSIVALNVLLIIVLAVKPDMVTNMYSSILGRLVLIGAVIFFSMSNVTLGLLVALVIISGLNQFGSFTEGMENKIEVTTSVDKDKLKEKVTVVRDAVVGVDKEDIKNAIMAKDSKTIPVSDKMTTSNEVSASTPTMLTTSKLEGFTSYGYGSLY
jgi:hypothetical protein